MNKFVIFLILLPEFVLGAHCLDLNGTWKGLCDRDGSVREESIVIKQNNCKHINFYGIDYKIGEPYEQRGEDFYERLVNIYNLYWGADGQSLFFNVDRIRWMKHKNIVSTGEGLGAIRLNNKEMKYLRSYSSRSRQGDYEKTIRKCKFLKIK
ncbi:MAG: hypothetical protein HOO06_16065 [Bdellovibrionaceae bacterium]|jgi:hypothetical protein|nr:hypothetical protein [Pseudobdellovibrionaceae bacterium]